MIKGVVKKFLVAVNDRVQFLRDSENHMEVRSVQHIFPACVHPLFLRKFLAHGAAPVTAGIIMDRTVGRERSSFILGMSSSSQFIFRIRL
jgi:hypothetical protein